MWIFDWPSCSGKVAPPARLRTFSSFLIPRAASLHTTSVLRLHFAPPIATLLNEKSDYMKANPVTVRHLLENRQRFCVPIYQRHYVWSREKQWEPFWSDVRTKAVERLAGRQKRFHHFMGAIVLEARNNASSRQVRSFLVVDGQQRLTTFQIFLAAARDYAEVKGYDETRERIDSFIFNEKEHLMEEPEVERYKVWPTEYDRELLQDVLCVGRSDLRNKYDNHFYKTRDDIYPYATVPNILGAYGYFFGRIKHAIETDDLEDDYYEESADQEGDIPSGEQFTDATQTELRLDAIWEALVEEFKVVEIVLEEGDDAQVIFETLNDRAEELLATDLVRNNIFQRADANLECAEKLFAQHWRHFEDPFWQVKEKQGRYKKARSELFLGNFVAGKLGEEITLSKLFSEYKAFVKSSYASPSPFYRNVQEELIDLERFGAVYRRLLGRSSDDNLGRFASDLSAWDVTTVFPLVLRLATEQFSPEELKLCLNMLLSLVVRRAVCHLGGKNYNKLFLSGIRILDREGWTEGALRNFLLSQASQSSRFPNDEEFRRGWVDHPIYNSLGSQRVRFLLENLEVRKRNRFHETSHLDSSLTVEHILPNSWYENWPLSDGTKSSLEEAFKKSLIFQRMNLGTVQLSLARGSSTPSEI